MMYKDLFIKLAASVEDIDKVSRQIDNELPASSVVDPESRREIIELLDALITDIGVLDHVLRELRARIS